MKTKALLLAAAFAAVGVSTTVAQVYSVNAVGYVNVTLPAGKFAMVANPLDAGAGNNTVTKLFSNVQGGVPNNSRVYVFNNATGGYATFVFNNILGGWSPAASAAATEVPPGTGVFFQNVSANNLTLTFVGEVQQGSPKTDIKTGFNIIGNPVPQTGKPDAFPNSTFPGANGDRIYRYNPDTGNYATHIFNSILGGWSPALPIINVGEAFFYSRAGGNTSWTRNFNVNNPA